MKVRIIKEAEVASVIKSITKGQFFCIKYQKKDGSYRTATAQLGVHTPKSIASPKGTGESASEALEKGRIKYFEPNHKNEDGTVSVAYRQANISRLHTISYKGTLYVVDHN